MSSAPEDYEIEIQLMKCRLELLERYMEMEERITSSSVLCRLTVLENKQDEIEEKLKVFRGL